jgi:hypothetical protein
MGNSILVMRLSDASDSLLAVSRVDGNIKKDFRPVLGMFLENEKLDLKKTIGMGVRLNAFKILAGMAGENPDMAMRFANSEMIEEILEGREKKADRLAKVSENIGKACDKQGRIKSEDLEYFSAADGFIDIDKIIDTEESMLLFTALSKLSFEETEKKVSVLKDINKVFNWDEVVKSRKDVIGFYHFIAPNLVRWMKENRDIAEAAPVLVKNIYDFGMMLESFEYLRIDKEISEKLFKHLARIKRAPPERDAFQVAYSLLIEAAGSETISKEESTVLLSKLLDAKKPADYFKFVKRDLVLAIKEKISDAGKENIIKGKDWKHILIKGIVGWKVPENKKYTLDVDGIVAEVNRLTRQLGAKPGVASDYLLALNYSLNFRFYSPRITRNFEEGYHRYHGFGSLSWVNGYHCIGGYIAGNMLALPSEVGHAVQREIDPDDTLVENPEFSDRMASVNPRRKLAHLGFEYAAEYVVQVSGFAEDMFERWVAGELSVNDVKTMLKVIKPRVSAERYRMLIKIAGTLKEKGAAGILVYLTPSEIYGIGKELAGSELELEDSRAKFRKEFILMMKERAEKEIDQVVGIYNSQIGGMAGVKDVLLGPYETYSEFHEMAERVSQDVFVHLVMVLRKSDISINILPYVNAKAMEWMLASTNQKHEADWRAIVRQARRIDTGLVHGWIDELVKERKVKVNMDAPSRELTFEDIMAVAAEKGVLAARAVWDSFMKLPAGDLLEGLMSIVSGRFLDAGTLAMSLSVGKTADLIRLLAGILGPFDEVAAALGVAVRKEREREEFRETLAQGTAGQIKRELGKFGITLEDAFTALLGMYARRAVSVTELGRLSGTVDEIRDALASHKTLKAVGVEETDVRVIEGQGLIGDTETFILAPFVISGKTGVLSISRTLAEALNMLSESARADYIASLVEREAALAEYRTQGISFDRARALVLRSKAQQSLVEFAKGVAASGMRIKDALQAGVSYMGASDIGDRERALLEEWADRLGIKRITGGYVTDYSRQSGTLMIEQNLLRKIIELHRIAPSLASDVVDITWAYEAALGDEKKFSRDSFFSSIPHLSGTGILATSLWFNMFSIDMPGQKDEIFKYITGELADYPTAGVSRVLVRVLEIDKFYIGRKRITEVPKTPGAIEPPDMKKPFIKEKTGIRRLVEVIISLGNVTTRPLSVPSTLAITANIGDFDTVKACVLGQKRVASPIDLLIMQIEILTGRTTTGGDSIFSDLSLYEEILGAK